eukprot:359284-Chlamydomonas_euryale.AAC.2
MPGKGVLDSATRFVWTPGVGASPCPACTVHACARGRGAGKGVHQKRTKEGLGLHGMRCRGAPEAAGCTHTT